MKFSNFNIVRYPEHQIIEIEYLKKKWDLHNAAEFIDFNYKFKESSLTVSWKYYTLDQREILFRMVFETVKKLQVLPSDSDLSRDDDDCLEEMLHSKHLEFKFMGGMRIIVEAETAKVETES